jgi:hypothetical protein
MCARGAFTWFWKFFNPRRWYRMCIDERLINGGGWSWCRQRRELLWCWEWRARIDLFQPSAEVRRLNTVWCAATGEELLWLNDDKAALRMHLYVKGCEEICNGAIALPRERGVVTRHEEVDLADTACGAQLANQSRKRRCGGSLKLNKI